MNPRQLYIQDPSSHRLRLTQAGLDKYAARFARVGYRACEIRTLDVLKEAIDASFDHEMAKLTATVDLHLKQTRDLHQKLTRLIGRIMT